MNFEIQRNFVLFMNRVQRGTPNLIFGCALKIECILNKIWGAFRHTKLRDQLYFTCNV